MVASPPQTPIGQTAPNGYRPRQSPRPQSLSFLQVTYVSLSVQFTKNHVCKACIAAKRVQSSHGIQKLGEQFRKRLCSCVRRDNFSSASRTRFAQTIIRAAIFSSPQLQVFARNYSKSSHPMGTLNPLLASLLCIDVKDSCKLDT